MWLLFFILMTGFSYADVYVLTDSNNSVIGLSEQNDMVVPKGYTMTSIKGNISNLPISGNPHLYNFINGTFVLNATAVQAQQKAEADAIVKQKSMDDARASAIGKLKVLGFTDDEIKALWQ